MPNIRDIHYCFDRIAKIFEPISDQVCGKSRSEITNMWGRIHRRPARVESDFSAFISFLQKKRGKVFFLASKGIVEFECFHVLSKIINALRIGIRHIKARKNLIHFRENFEILDNH